MEGMGGVSIFKKEIRCERCGTEVLKKQASRYDSTCNGWLKEGTAKTVCQDCAFTMLIEEIQKFSGRAVFVYPSAKYNSYVFYPFAYLLNQPQNHQKDLSFLTNMKDLLPSEDVVCSCGQKANFRCGSLGIFQNNDPFSWKVNERSDIDLTCLCKDCLTKELKKTINEEKIHFDAVYPPVSGDGFMVPWSI